MPSSISSSELHADADRLHVPQRAVPDRGWPALAAAALLLCLLALGAWEWRMRGIGLEAGDLDDAPAGWVEARRTIDSEPVAVALVGDSRLLFGADLDRFQRLTGIRPVQLSMRGTNAQFLLDHVAADADFRGLAIVTFNEPSSFSGRIGARVGGAEQAFARYAYESPAQRSGHLLHRALSSQLAFLDENYRLSVLLRRLDRGARAGVPSPYVRPWKLSVTGAQRETRMWRRIEAPGFLQEQAREAWLATPLPPPLAPEQRDAQIARTRAAIESIRARGGDVVYVRPPSDGPLYARHTGYLPRSDGWEALLAGAGVKGVHFEDLPALAGIALPEYSHVSAACAPVMTDAFVRAIAALGLLELRDDAPPALAAADCASSAPAATVAAGLVGG